MEEKLQPVEETTAAVPQGEITAADDYKKEDYTFKKRQLDFLKAFEASVAMYGVTIKPAIIFTDLLAAQQPGPEEQVVADVAEPTK